MMKKFVVLGAVLLAACNQQPNEEVASENALNDRIANIAEAPAAEATQAAPSKPNYNDSGKQVAWIERGKNAIREKLRDPSSAEFRNVTFHSGGGVPMACGEVNANNGFGGKGGYERFIAAGTTMAVLESEMTTAAEMTEVWDRYCVG